MTKNTLNTSIFKKIKFLVRAQEVIFDDWIIGIVKQEYQECKYIKSRKNFHIYYVEKNILLIWNLPESIINQNCINKQEVIKGNNINKINNRPIQINEYTLSSTGADYSHTIYVSNNVMQLEPLDYILTEEIIASHVRYYIVLQHF